jgi:hypothetical protein
LVLGKGHRLLIFVNIFLIFCISSISVQGSSNVVIEKTSHVTSIIDGNTLKADPIEKIGLADIEIVNNREAMDFLERTLLPNNEKKEVFLDIDDYNAVDADDRTICVIYLIHNWTHLKNLNKAIAKQEFAKINDQDNQFNPNTWEDYIPYNKSTESQNPQNTLIAFFGQELVSHGAMLFAASAATFTFVTKFIRKTKKRLHNIIFVLISGILIGSILFLGFRLIFYGHLTNKTIHFRPPIENEPLEDYDNAISRFIDYDTSPDKIASLRLNLMKTVKKGFIDFNPFGIIFVSIYIGLCSAYILYYTFSGNEIDGRRAWSWFLYFVFPSILGFSGAILFPRIDVVPKLIVGILLILYYPIVAYFLLCTRGRTSLKTYESRKKELKKIRGELEAKDGKRRSFDDVIMELTEFLAKKPLNFRKVFCEESQTPLDSS